MAILLVQTPTSFLMNLLGQTLLPAFSQVQDDLARTNRILIKVTWRLCLLECRRSSLLSSAGDPCLRLRTAIGTAWRRDR